MKTSVWYSLTLVAACSSISAQEVADLCRPVLELASADTRTELVKAEKSQYLYNQICEATSLKKGLSFGFGSEKSFTLGVSSLLDSLGFSFGSTEERARQFCKIDQSSYREILNRYQTSSTVVRESISAWRDCREMNASGIEFRPTFNRDNLLITIRPPRDQVTRIEVVRPSDMACKALNTTDTNPSWIDIDEGYRAQVEESWQLNCSREPTNVDGTLRFSEASLLLSTRNKNFSLKWPSDAKLPVRMASKLTERIEEVNSRVSAINADPWPKGRYCIVGSQTADSSDSCPKGFTPQALMGFIIHKDDNCPYTTDVGGPYGEAWKWCHPRVCCRY